MSEKINLKWAAECSKEQVELANSMYISDFRQYYYKYPKKEAGFGENAILAFINDSKFDQKEVPMGFIAFKEVSQVYNLTSVMAYGVLPKYRNKGYGQKILNKGLEKFLKANWQGESSIDTIFAYVIPNATGEISKKCLLKAGFKEYSKDLTTIRFKKEIDHTKYAI